MVACLTPAASTPAFAIGPRPRTNLLPPAGELVLRVHAPAGESQTVHLRSNKCTIGSAAGCTLRLRSPSVLALHCWILRGAAGTIVRRLQHATMLNGRALVESALRPGDRLQVGSLELEVIACNEPVKQEPAFFTPPPEALNEVVQLRCQLTAQEEKTKRVEAEARQGFESSIMAAERADQLRDALAAAHEQLEEACRDLARAQSSQQAQAQELQASQQQRQALETNQQALSQQLEQARSELQAVSRERESLVCEAQAVQATVAELRGAVADQEANLQSQQAQFQAERSSWESERKNLAAERENLESERTQLQRRLHQRDAELDALRSTTMAQTGAMTVAISELSETQRSLKEELSERCAALTAQVAEKQSQLDRQQEQLAAKQQELDCLQQALTDHQAKDTKLAELERCYAEKCAQCDAQELELGGLKANTIVFGQIDEREQTLLGREIALAEHEEAVSQREAKFAQREAVFTQREAELAQRDVGFGQRETELMQREAGLAEREAFVASREGSFAERENCFGERERDLADRVAKLEADRRELEVRQQELNTSAGDLNGQQQQLAGREEEWVRREQELAARAEQLNAQCDAIASERHEMTGLRDQLQDERNELLLQRQELSEAQEQLTRREFQVAEHEAQRGAFPAPACEATLDTAALEQQAAELEGQLAAAADRLVALTQLQEQCLEQRATLASREQQLAMRASELDAREQHLTELACQLEQRLTQQPQSCGPAVLPAACQLPAEPELPAACQHDSPHGEDQPVNVDADCSGGPQAEASFEPPANMTANWTPEGLAALVNGGSLSGAFRTNRGDDEQAAEGLRNPAPDAAAENVHDSCEVDAVLSRLVRAGLWRSGEAPEAAGEAGGSSEAEREALSRRVQTATGEAELPLGTGTGDGPSSGSGSGDGDEESIESYMERLMKRVRGDAPGAPSDSKPLTGSRPTPPPVVAPPPTIEDTANSEPAEYSPRRMAPELNENLTAMRELANTAARSAIDRHVRQSTVRKAYGKLVGACSTVTASLVLGYWAWHVQSFPASVAGGIGGAVGGYWTLTAIRRLATLRRLNREQLKAEQAKAAQSQALPAPIASRLDQ